MNLHALHFRPFTALKTTLAAVCLTGVAFSTASASITIDYVPVGNAGNPNDSTGYGEVSYDYNIGKYEVTLTQYTAFLNAVAATDTNALYNTNMGTNLNIAGITRSGISGAYSYAVVGDGNRPVTYVRMLDAMRFANWMGNGQPTGAQNASTTETGAYTMSLNDLATRNVGATVFVTSENEWYKAAYYQPAAAGGDVDGYWLYPTQSNSAPGNNIGALANQANYRESPSNDYSVTQSATYSATQNYLTAGGAYSNSASYYGTFDQGGNVWEWNESFIGSGRGLRGGAWNANSSALPASFRWDFLPTETAVFGFRLASVPEPTAVVMLMLGLGVTALRRRRPFNGGP